MLVREATPDDYDEIARITLAAYRALDRWVGDDYARTLAAVAERAAGATVLVAEDDTGGGVADDTGGREGNHTVRLLGSVTLTLDPGQYFEWRWGVDGDCGFRMLAVDPAVWGRGAGPALVRECLRRARAAGRHRMIIGSTTWMTTAHRMYEALGFKRRPDLDQQWGDVTGLAFCLDLDAWAASA